MEALSNSKGICFLHRLTRSKSQLPSTAKSSVKLTRNCWHMNWSCMRRFKLGNNGGIIWFKRNFFFYTDHHILKFINSQTKVNRMHARWLLFSKHLLSFLSISQAYKMKWQMNKQERSFISYRSCMLKRKILKIVGVGVRDSDGM